MIGIKCKIAFLGNEYIPCEYILNDAKSYYEAPYINTGLVMNSTFKIECQYSIPKNNGTFVLYSANEAGRDDQLRAFGNMNTMYFASGAYRSGYFFSTSLDTKYTSIHDLDTATINGISVGTNSNADGFSSTAPLLINRDSFFTYYNPIAIYYMKVWLNNALVLDLIPAMYAKTKEYGLLDKVENKFYGSANSKKFTGKILSGGVAKHLMLMAFLGERRAA